MTSILYAGNKLSRHGYTPGVIETLGPLLEAEGYRVFYAGTKKNQVLRLAEMLFRTLTRGRKADYILIDTYSTSAFWYAYLIGRLANMLGKKYIPILHGGDLPSRIKKSKRECDKLFLHSHANVAVSGYLQHVFETYNYPVVLIPNNIEIEKYPFKTRHNPRPKLLWVRAFSKIYNPKMAADVLAELLKSYPDAELCMVGPDKDGSLKEFIQYARGKEVDTHIKITGKLTREEWTKLSERYDFFINTTNIDNTPISVIEAMALGMCIVSTNPGGIPYLLDGGKDSFLVNPGDYQAMANKIIQGLKNPSLMTSISEAVRLKVGSFDWHNIRTKWINLLN